MSVEEAKVAQPLDDENDNIVAQPIEKKKNPPTCHYEAFTNIQQFKKSTISLLQEDVMKTRYIIRYNASTGKTELSSTNDKKLYKFSTDDSGELSKMHDINLNVLRSFFQRVNIGTSGQSQNPQKNQNQRNVGRGSNQKKKKGGKKKKKKRRRK